MDLFCPSESAEILKVSELLQETKKQYWAKIRNEYKNRFLSKIKT